MAARCVCECFFIVLFFFRGVVASVTSFVMDYNVAIVRLQSILCKSKIVPELKT